MLECGVFPENIKGKHHFWQNVRVPPHKACRKDFKT